MLSSMYSLNESLDYKSVFHTQLGASCIHCLWHITHTHTSESVQLNKGEKNYLGAYALANSAASGAQPVSMSKSTHVHISPSSKDAANARLFAPVFSARPVPLARL